MSETRLARKVSQPLLTFYGLGTILGAGIYVLIGEVSLRAQEFSFISFVLAACIAGVTAYSFARLSSMYPKSAGPAAYAFAAFNIRTLSALVGLTVVTIGSVSAATMVKGFAAYFSSMVEINDLYIIIGIIIFITAFSIWGISQSILLASLITIIEVLGLLFVIYVVFEPSELTHYQPPSPIAALTHTPVIFYAAFISFYAYIGFEDIVTIAEETIDAKRVVPMAILLSLLFSTLLYVAIAIACAIFVPVEIFETSQAPLVSIVEYKGYSGTTIAIVSMIAIINGALVQQIMAARILYGMASEKVFISIFKQISARTQTPVIATIAIALVILILTSQFDLVTLAEITSALTLAVFIIVQASLLYISSSNKSSNKLDYVMPMIGILLNILLVIFGLASS